MFWELEKAIFGPEKEKWWNWGSNTPKPPEMPIKQGKTSQHHNWPPYMDWPQIGPKCAIKQGKKLQKDKWYPFRAPTDGPSSLLHRIARFGGPGAQGTTPIFEKEHRTGWSKVKPVGFAASHQFAEWLRQLIRDLVSHGLARQKQL